jgi:hypothetical protein
MTVRLPLLLLTCMGLAACDPITMGLVTAGGGVAVNHQMSATITRTFSDGAPDVQAALIAALGKMSIAVTHREQRGQVEVISGTAGTRAVTMRVEPVTRTSTLLEVAVHQDMLTMDGATAREIVAQTEQALTQAGNPPMIANNATSNRQVNRAAPAAVSDGLPGRTTYYGRDSDAPRSSTARSHERNAAAAANNAASSVSGGAGTAASRTRSPSPSPSPSGAAAGSHASAAPQAQALLPAPYGSRSLAAASAP